MYVWLIDTIYCVLVWKLLHVYEMNSKYTMLFFQELLLNVCVCVSFKEWRVLLGGEYISRKKIPRQMA